jgi:methylmalonyl-CoA mutase cobalamin-binding domain/chain
VTDTSESYLATNRASAYQSSDEATFETPTPQTDIDLKEPIHDLRKTIESEILPRLMLVHSDHPTVYADSAPRLDPIGTDNINRFVRVMIDHSATSGREIIDDYVRNGMAMEKIYLDLLAPAAQRMGELWEDDIRNFTEVTIGLCRLHEIIRHNSLSSSGNHLLPTPETPSILLSTACDDQHVFGVIMVAEFFRKAGWQVTCEPSATMQELVRISALHNYDVIGLSIARSYEATEISEVIQNLRKSSHNPDVKIMLGGALIARDASFADAVGADIAVTDAERAPTAAMNLLAHSRVGC